MSNTRLVCMAIGIGLSVVHFLPYNDIFKLEGLITVIFMTVFSFIGVKYVFHFREMSANIKLICASILFGLSSSHFSSGNNIFELEGLIAVIFKTLFFFIGMKYVFRFREKKNRNCT